jgi:hypothetical protein
VSEAYHSALREDAVQAPRVYRWERKGCQAFVHDISIGLPMEMHACDVLYVDLPWLDGYDEFNRRAGKGLVIPYEKWLYRLSGTLSLSGKPWVASGGAAALRGLGAEWVTRFQLNGSTAVLMGAGLSPVVERDQFAVLAHLAKRFACVGDFCAGYGRTARAFLHYGKKFVVSDMNPRCIGYIAENAPRWEVGRCL